MLYRVTMDDEDILDYDNETLKLKSMELSVKLNEAGQFEFTIPLNHQIGDNIGYLKPTIEVFERDASIWFGRPVEIKKNIFGEKQVYCEGALAFLNDSIQRPHEYSEMSRQSIFQSMIADHNSQVMPNRRFTVGNVTAGSDTMTLKTNYDKTLDAVKKVCFDGYLFTRRVNGINYIDWLSAMPYTCNQAVEVGKNLLDLFVTQNSAGYATCLIPLGDTDSQTHERLTVSSVNSGSDILESFATDYYGMIIKVVVFDGITSASDLMQAGQDYLLTLQFDDTEIECSAADLGYLNSAFDDFRVGQVIHCTSQLHLIDHDFPISAVKINLNTARKTITLGTTKRQSLTQSYSKSQDKTNDLQETVTDMQGQIDGIRDQISSGGGSAGTGSGGTGSTGTGSGDGWIHQVDGVTQATGTIDFITEMSS